MSAPVDVLAIGVEAAIANCAYYLREEAGLTTAAEQMEAVNATVVELIEALRPLSVFPAFHDLEDDVVVFESNGKTLTAGDVRNAKRVIAKATGGAA